MAFRWKSKFISLYQSKNEGKKCMFLAMVSGESKQAEEKHFISF